MKRKLLPYLLILSLLVYWLPAKTGSAADYKYAVEEGDRIVNISPQFMAPHYINGFCFSEMVCYWYNNYINIECTVTNTSDVEREIDYPEMYIYDDTGMAIVHVRLVFNNLRPGRDIRLFSGTIVDASVVGDAYDYNVVFSPEDIWNPDEEVIINKGIICSSHEIKEHDSVALICEESGVKVTYQWFCSESEGGEGSMIEGATGRRLVLSDVSLEQSGQYYYCQIKKKGKKEYTERFELIVTPSVPAVSLAPVPTDSAKPSPAATASPTPETSAKPTVRPTVAPSAKPTAEPSAKPTAEPTGTPSVKPTATVSPSPSIAPDSTAVPEISETPVSGTSPKPIISPDITASPGPVSQTSPSPEVSPSVSPPQMQTLLKVQKIKAQQTADLKTKLTWKQITAAQIAVLRAGKKNGPYRIIKQFSGSRSSYTDKTVKRGKTYYYKVVAHNGDLQTQLSQKDLEIKKITVSYLMSPVISVKKGTSGRQKYVQIFMRKYEGQYADIYMKSNGHFQKLAMKKRTIRSYRGKYRFRYRSGGVTLYFRVRTYQMVKGRKRTSSYSKTARIKI